MSLSSHQGHLCATLSVMDMDEVYSVSPWPFVHDIVRRGRA
jgi:hypothetical protein